MYCDNEAIYENIVHPDSIIKNKHHCVEYHMHREAGASWMIRVVKEETQTNIADLFTKPLSAPWREDLVDLFTFWMKSMGLYFLGRGPGFHKIIFYFFYIMLIKRTEYIIGNKSIPCNLLKGTELIASLSEWVCSRNTWKQCKTV